MNTSNNTETGPHYEFEAIYHYGEGERYSTGHGLSVMSKDLAHLEKTFETFKRGTEPYAITITRLDNHDVIRSHGDMAAAKRSSATAYNLRYSKGKIMSKNHSVAEVFDALLKQTQQRGGSPSVREISDAALAVAGLVAAYTEVRAYAVEAGMSQTLARAIENADAALAVVEGTNH